VVFKYFGPKNISIKISPPDQLQLKKMLSAAAWQLQKNKFSIGHTLQGPEPRCDVLVTNYHTFWLKLPSQYANFQYSTVETKPPAQFDSVGQPLAAQRLRPRGQLVARRYRLDNHCFKLCEVANIYCLWM